MVYRILFHKREIAMEIKTRRETSGISPAINTAILSVGTATSKMLGFVREIVTAAFFGTSKVVDAYLVALVIPQMLFSVVGSALTTTLIPLATEYEEKEGRESVLALVNSVITIVAIVLSILVLLGELFTGFLVHIVAPGFSGEVFELTVRLSKIMFPMMLFLGLAGLGTGVLQSQKKFLYPAFIGVPYNIFIIGSLLLLGAKWGITGLAVGTLLGVVSQWLFQVPELRRVGFKYKLKLTFSHPGFRKMGVLILPVIVGSGAGQINLLVDRILASSLNEGSIAALHYATKLNILVFGIIAVAVANAIYPELAQSAAINDTRQFLRSLISSLNSLFLVIMPITVGIIILREPIVRIVYQRGEFDSNAAGLTAIALLFFALGLPAMSLREVVFRAFYSLQDTLTPMYIGLATVAINIGFNLVLVRYLAHGGLALGTSISFIFSIIMLLWSLRRKIGHIGGKILLTTGAKIIVASVIMGIGVFLLYMCMGSILKAGFKADIIMFFSAVILGALIYGLMVKILHLEEAEWVINKTKARLNL